ncbi:unnamed protein product, partial [Mesorhabditis spiculigera]
MLPANGHYDGMFSDETIIISDPSGVAYDEIEAIEAIEVDGQEDAIEIYSEYRGRSVNALGMPSPLIGGDQADAQYDDDVRFQAFIAARLAELNDRDKAFIKLEIQRILLDARVGAGTAANMIKQREDAVRFDQEHEPSPGDHTPVHSPPQSPQLVADIKQMKD